MSPTELADVVRSMPLAAVVKNWRSTSDRRSAWFSAAARKMASKLARRVSTIADANRSVHTPMRRAAAPQA